MFKNKCTCFRDFEPEPNVMYVHYTPNSIWIVCEKKLKRSLKPKRLIVKSIIDIKLPFGNVLSVRPLRYCLIFQHICFSDRAYKWLSYLYKPTIFTAIYLTKDKISVLPKNCYIKKWFCEYYVEIDVKLVYTLSECIRKSNSVMIKFSSS